MDIHEHSPGVRAIPKSLVIGNDITAQDHIRPSDTQQQQQQQIGLLGFH